MDLNKLLIRITLFSGLFIISCSPKISHNMLSFFFDGVPDPLEISKISSVDTLNISDTAQVISPVVKIARPSLFMHLPYEQKDCMSCHDKRSPGDLTMSEPGLCYSCHENFDNKYKYLHGPVSEGYCSLCHNPHMSETAKLLSRKGQELCYFCHSPEDILSLKTHTEIENSDCQSCHNPHGMNRRFRKIY